MIFLLSFRKLTEVGAAALRPRPVLALVAVFLVAGLAAAFSFLGAAAFLGAAFSFLGAAAFSLGAAFF